MGNASIEGALQKFFPTSLYVRIFYQSCFLLFPRRCGDRSTVSTKRKWVWWLHKVYDIYRTVKECHRFPWKISGNGTRRVLDLYFNGSVEHFIFFNAQSTAHTLTGKSIYIPIDILLFQTNESRIFVQVDQDAWSLFLLQITKLLATNFKPTNKQISCLSFREKSLKWHKPLFRTVHLAPKSNVRKLEAIQKNASWQSSLQYDTTAQNPNVAGTFKHIYCPMVVATKLTAQRSLHLPRCSVHAFRTSTTFEYPTAFAAKGKQMTFAQALKALLLPG